jgi:DNA-binding CsgD family transcriptional regulator
MMWRTTLIYGAILAAGVFALEWLEYRVLLRTHPFAVYLGMFALAFMALGAWFSYRVFRRPAAGPVELNTAALASLGVSAREREVLEQLAAGRSNKEIAAKLEVSPNTVKTHIASLFGKLGVKRRTAAIHKARELGILQ